MATPKKNHKYVGFYVPVDVLDRFERLFPHMRTHILNKFIKYAIENKHFVVENLISDDYD